MNIFKKDTRFVDLDNRKNRSLANCSAESLYNKFLVQLPEELIKDKTVLDLGSCLGAAGHWSLTYGAKHYTGVEIQDYYVNTSNQLLSAHWDSTQFEIVKQDIEKFLDKEIADNKKYDYIVAAGILFGFLDVVSLLKKITSIAGQYIIIDTLHTPTLKQPDAGQIVIKKTSMVRGSGVDCNELFHGYGSLISCEALDIVMSTNSYYRDEPILLPIKTNDGIDPYRDHIKFSNGELKPGRYIVRYVKKDIVKKTLNDLVLTDDSKSLKTFNDHYRDNFESVPTWQFNKNVASRFQQEAESHIPDYKHVIRMCVDIAENYINKKDLIIDIGSALGYTINEFKRAGFDNIIGVESSKDMIEQSLFSKNIIHKDTLPENNYQLVLMNWTLHFIKEKTVYLKDIHKNLNDNGILMLTDKTIQSDLTKSMYYKFKSNNGVSQEYISLKEQQLMNIMFTESVEWYLTTLSSIFSTVEIINSRLGFTTFLCVK